MTQVNGYAYSIPGVLYMSAFCVSDIYMSGGLVTAIWIDSKVEDFGLDAYELSKSVTDCRNSRLTSQKYWGLA